VQYNEPHTLVKPIKPALAALYGAFSGALIIPICEDMLMILPQPEK